MASKVKFFLVGSEWLLRFGNHCFNQPFISTAAVPKVLLRSWGCSKCWQELLYVHTTADRLYGSKTRWNVVYFNAIAYTLDAVSNPIPA